MKSAPRINVMEVCGTHTMAIARAGLRSLFPANVNLLSGPGCPICVTPVASIDRVILLARQPDTIVTTFGDLVRVPGSTSSLEQELAAGRDVRIVYSPADALDIARAHPGKNVVFIGVGFETTAPAVAATVIRAQAARLKNFSVLPLFKTVPAALRYLLGISGRKIHGFILPGHVSTVIGTAPYEFVAREFGIPGVVTGFEPSDIRAAVGRLVELIGSQTPEIENYYTRAVAAAGNPAAQAVVKAVFATVDAEWRSIGRIRGSGLAFAAAYASFDAAERFSLPLPRSKEPKGCRCGDILLGCCAPDACPLFGNACTPRAPVGPCMVSSEGPCAAEYRYGTRSTRRTLV